MDVYIIGEKARDTFFHPFGVRPFFIKENVSLFSYNPKIVMRNGFRYISVSIFGDELELMFALREDKTEECVLGREIKLVNL